MLNRDLLSFFFFFRTKTLSLVDTQHVHLESNMKTVHIPRDLSARKQLPLQLLMFSLNSTSVAPTTTQACSVQWLVCWVLTEIHFHSLLKLHTSTTSSSLTAILPHPATQVISLLATPLATQNLQNLPQSHLHTKTHSSTVLK